MNAASLKEAMGRVAAAMAENKDYLVELDQRNGDGDLGISMSEGYRAAADCMAVLDEPDLGRLLMKGSSAFNEAAPSSLGTITSIGMMGMAKSLKGKQEATLEELAAALRVGLENVMTKAKSKPGEKTILDALFPAVEALEAHAAKGSASAFAAAAQAAAEGAEKTKEMRSVHGRAAYYGDKSIGMVDGGAVAGRILFDALRDYAQGKQP